MNHESGGGQSPFIADGGVRHPSLAVVQVISIASLRCCSFFVAMQGDWRAPRGPMWLPRGLRLRSWTGGAFMPQRPPTLLRPTHPSWSLPGPRPVDVRPLPGAALARPRPPPGAAICRLTYERAAKRAREDDTARGKALGSFAQLLSTYREYSGLAKLMTDGGEAFTEVAPSLVAALEARKTATLAKRAGSLRLYHAWFATTGRPASEIFAERTVFEHMTYLNEERVGATRGLALSQAINFAGGLFKFDVAAVAGSPRVRGLVVRLLKTRQPLRQRAPLTVAMVAFLENLSCDSEEDEEGILAGAALFCLYARARVGDLRRSPVDPVLDIAAGGRAGFVQGAFFEHKTAKAGSKISLPIVAPVPGVTGRNWAAPWLDRRRRLRLVAADCGTLLPAPAAGGGWTKVPMKTVEFGVALRVLLKKGGFTAEALDAIGAHSLKTTTLSWMAKAGIDRDSRRALGYHVRADERSMEAYSRDSLAGPLRLLAKVIEDIQAKRFEPDSTRSGFFASAAPSAPPTAPPSSTCSSRSSSASSLADSDNGGAELDESPPEWLNRIVRNDVTKYFHVCTEGRLECGKNLPLRHTFFDEPPAGARLCAKCF